MTKVKFRVFLPEQNSNGWATFPTKFRIVIKREDGDLTKAHGQAINLAQKKHGKKARALYQDHWSE